MPLPGTKVIHPRFSPAHQAVSEAAMTGVCDITRPGTGRGTMAADGTVTNPATTVAADVPCRITAQNGDDRTTVAGEQLVTYRRYDVAIAADLEVQEGDVITVLVAKDPHLTGRSLRVTDMQHGTEVWQRTFTAIDDLG